VANTKHYNLPEMPTGAVEWPALFNDVVDKLEVGRTIKIVAGEALTVRKVFYIKNDGKAWKATNVTDAFGMWQSESTGVGAQGYGQVGGVMTYASWTWTPGAILYSDVNGDFTTVVTGRPVAYALSATEIVLYGLAKTDIYDTPVDGATVDAISSNWAFDHNAADTEIHGAGANTLLHSASNIDEGVWT